MIQVTPLSIPDVMLVKPHIHRDERGLFLETYRVDAYVAVGISTSFVQDNVSRSHRGTVRGLHFQMPPHAQGKLVSVLRGSIYDVAVDLRRGSPTFGQWVGTVLDDESMAQVYIPRGFAHGFAVRSDVADVFYKVDAPYNRSAEAGIRWDDRQLAIDWPVDAPVLSTKDRALPPFGEVDAGFLYRPVAERAQGDMEGGSES